MKKWNTEPQSQWRIYFDFSMLVVEVQIMRYTKHKSSNWILLFFFSPCCHSFYQIFILWCCTSNFSPVNCICEQQKYHRKLHICVMKWASLNYFSNLSFPYSLSPSLTRFSSVLQQSRLLFRRKKTNFAPFFIISSHKIKFFFSFDAFSHEHTAHVPCIWVRWK